MIEIVNPSHPDKVADRIAGAIVDLAYGREKDPKIAVEVLIGHGHCYVIAESNIKLRTNDIKPLVYRITGKTNIKVHGIFRKQDENLAKNQEEELRCGDNGIFKGLPPTEEEKHLTNLAGKLYRKFPTDGKYILDFASKRLIICQSCAKEDEIREIVDDFITRYKLKTKIKKVIINPLGEWTGGVDVDSGATNRKLGSDLGHSITGGGINGKDLSKSDITLSMYAMRKAVITGEPVELCCAIGDDKIDGKKYSEIVAEMKGVVDRLGGFEQMAEWGLI